MSNLPASRRLAQDEISPVAERGSEDGSGEHELERYARTLTPSIREDGVRKILAGETTLEEVLRVTRSD